MDGVLVHDEHVAVGGVVLTDDDAAHCVVCLEPTTAALEPCRHSLCSTCAGRWLPKSPTCPVCRGVVVAARLPYACLDGALAVVVPSPVRPLGVTLTDAPGGTRIVRLVRKDEGWRCGLRRGDLVTHVNEIPVQHHSHAVRIVDAAMGCGAPLVLHVRRRPLYWLLC